MNFDDDNELIEESTGSDELLSDDNLRLPADANPLARLHAVRAWLSRRQKETEQEIGLTALAIQQLQQHNGDSPRPRRRELEAHQARLDQALHTLQTAQQRLQTYEEASELLEDCVTHTTISERLLVEYYLTLDNLVQDAEQTEPSPRAQTLADILHRVERVGCTVEED